jgi:hypothetical protein
MRYTELDQMLKGRNAQSKKWANNTYLHRRGDDIALQYHNTDVATFKPNGDIVLNSGGWFTSTTKERINWALMEYPFGLRQNKGVWYLSNNATGTSYRFADSMVYHTLSGKVDGYTEDTPKADKDLKKRVKAYAQKCADAIPLDHPDSGDCWYCYLVTTNGDTLGDASKNTEHLDNHIEEGYIVPSLVYNALTECYNAKMAFWQAFKDTGYNNNDREFGRKAVAKAVYRYILKRKGLAV